MFGGYACTIVSINMPFTASHFVGSSAAYVAIHCNQSPPRITMTAPVSVNAAPTLPLRESPPYYMLCKCIECDTCLRFAVFRDGKWHKLPFGYGPRCIRVFDNVCTYCEQHAEIENVPY